MQDSIIMECVSALVNTKLTPNTYNGAEGFNNSFNDNLNTLQQLNLTLDDKITKCLYLSNITDKENNTIKDQPQLYQTVEDVQTHILRKYISTKGERRPGAPKYYARRFLHYTGTDDNPYEILESDPEETAEVEPDLGQDPQGISQQFKTVTQSDRKFPMIPHNCIRPFLKKLN